MAVQLQARVTGLSGVRRNLKEARKAYRIAGKRTLEYWGDQIISGIRRDRTLFRYAIPPIRGSGRRRGALKASLWRGRTKRDARGLVVELGWGVPYGPVLEHGPESARVWKIRPSGFRAGSGRSGGQTGLEFLRFRGSDGGIHYAREVTHRWSEAQKRPHFEPHTEFRVKMLARDLGRKLSEAL